MTGVKLRNRRLFTVSVIAYIIILFAYAFWNYRYHKREIMAAVDARLYNGAAVMKYVLPDDFHDRAMDPDAVSKEEDLSISRKLTKLIQETGFKFTYSVIRKGNELFFVASDIAADPKTDRGTFFFYPYKDADGSFIEAFHRDKPTYKTVSDQWGKFRTVMIPEKSPGGVPYLACADYDISYLNGLLKQNMQQSILSVLLLLLLAIPVILTYGRSRRQFSAALAESELKFRNFAEQSIVGIYLIQNGIFRYVNPRFAEIFGKTVPECLDDLPFQTFVHPDDKKKVEEQIRKRTHGKKETAHYTFKGIKKTGDVIYVEIFGTVTVLNGKPAVAGTMLDITLREQTEAALRESERNLQSVFDAVPFGICFMKNRVYSRVNRNWCNSFGYSEAELMGKTTEFLYENREEYERVGDAINADIRERGMASVDSRLRRSDGTLREVTLTAKPLNRKEPEDGMVVVVHDITEQKRIEAEREGLEDQLRQSQKMEAIGTLAGGIAHDFNNILGGIIGYAELAKMKAAEGGDVMPDLNQLMGGANRAAKLVRHILTVSRRHNHEQRPVRIRTIAAEALKLLKSTLPATIEIRENLTGKSGIVQGDPTQIHQVVMNLCTNAGYAMEKDGGILKVELESMTLNDLEASKYLDIRPGSYQRLSVSDTGHGMNPSMIERIFDPYFTTKDAGEGTGLGLSVAQGIVNAHGGTITVDSEPGRGTIFHVYFPVIPDTHGHNVKPEEPLPTGKERILIVDDEPLLLDTGSQMLMKLGYEVMTAKSGHEALELFQRESHRFDLVMTDMTMPRMTGDKLAAELMKSRPGIRVILCTGHSSLVSEEKAKRLGIRAFMMKPLRLRPMAETVRRVLDE